MEAKRIVLVEDDAAFGLMLQGWLKKQGFHPELCTTLKQAKAVCKSEHFDLVLTDLRLPDGSGIELLEWIRGLDLNWPLLIMTGYGEVQTAVQAMKSGADDYLEKPVNPEILREKIQRLLAEKPAGRTMSGNSGCDTSDASASGKSASVAATSGTAHLHGSGLKTITGSSAKARQMYEFIRMVAPTRMSVMILGESGTGKEHVARLIHAQSDRKEKTFIAVDCGSLSRDLAPSELFGHLKGSFTSAITDKKGVFEQAAGGTVFLDEIGNLSYEVQVQLLRALQERKVRPVGSAEDVDIDVRLLSATNEDLKKAIAEGRFREDLYHRLNELEILVPPLRERKADIPSFAAFFLEEANGELNKQLKGLDAPSLDALTACSWSGNLRELRNVIRRAALFADTDYITIDQITLPESETETDEISVLPLRIEDERQRIINALERAEGNKSLAAKLLKIDRKTLYNKLDQYEISL